MKHKILVIEDETAMRSFIVDVLKGEGYDVDEAEDGDQGLLLSQTNEYDLVISDLRMPGKNGLDLIKALKNQPDSPEVVIITAYGTVSTAVEAMKAGATDFLEKPLPNPERIRTVARMALERHRLITENERLRGIVKSQDQDFIAEDPTMKKIISMLEKVGHTDATVLILGESGVGKEVVARALHRIRFANGGPFVAINCAAVPEGLLESEMFGHEKGAFTGASERKIGVFELAKGGTLLLDEISELPLSLQAKLLRVLETREFKRVGGIKTITTNARFVAASNQDLEDAVLKGRFRGDLYYRLNVITIKIPPLRERPNDIIPLAQYFLRISKHGGASLTISEEAKACLMSYDWPGNVRELRNAIERACILAQDKEITPEDLGLPIRVVKEDRGLLAELERETILKVLKEVQGNRKKAAQRLGISLRTLQYRLKEFGYSDD